MEVLYWEYFGGKRICEWCVLVVLGTGQPKKCECHKSPFRISEV